MALTEQETRKLAEEKVHVYMTLGDIQDACRKFGIRVVKNRHTMEQKLTVVLCQEKVQVKRELFCFSN